MPVRRATEDNLQLLAAMKKALGLDDSLLPARDETGAPLDPTNPNNASRILAACDKAFLFVKGLRDLKALQVWRLAMAALFFSLYSSVRIANVPFDVNSAGGLETVTKDQKNTGSNGAWVLLGTYTFNKGTGGSVTIRTDATNGVVVADAVRFLSSAPVTNKQAAGITITSSSVASTSVFSAAKIATSDEDLLKLG